MKTWWQRKTVGIEVVMMWVLGILVVSVFVLWATAGRAEECPDGQLVCLSGPPGSAFDIERMKREDRERISHLRAKDFETQLQCDISPSQALCNTDPAYQDHICRNRMESAMRAMERYQEKEESWVTVSDATSTITWNDVYIHPAPMPTCCDPMLYLPKPEPPPPTLEEKIEALEQETTKKIRQMKKAAAEAEEARGWRIVNRAFRTWAFANWESVKKECWRKP